MVSFPSTKVDLFTAQYNKIMSPPGGKVEKVNYEKESSFLSSQSSVRAQTSCMYVQHLLDPAVLPIMEPGI